MTTRTYVSPGAFKQALEQRLRSSAATLVFDRFLARIAHCRLELLPAARSQD